MNKPNYSDLRNDDGKTPLHIAVEQGQFEIVRYIIENTTAEKEPEDDNDYKPLHFAAENGHLSVLEYLLDSNNTKNKEPKTKYGATPINVAAEALNLKTYKVVKYLKSQGYRFSERKSTYKSIIPKEECPNACSITCYTNEQDSMVFCQPPSKGICNNYQGHQTQGIEFEKKKQELLLQ